MALTYPIHPEIGMGRTSIRPGTTASCTFAFVALIIVAVFTWETPLQAYLDPGSGSMFIQLLFGGVAGAAVLLRLAWRGLRDWLGLSRVEDRPPQRDD